MHNPKKEIGRYNSGNLKQIKEVSDKIFKLKPTAFQVCKDEESFIVQEDFLYPEKELTLLSDGRVTRHNIEASLETDAGTIQSSENKMSYVYLRTEQGYRVYSHK